MPTHLTSRMWRRLSLVALVLVLAVGVVAVLTTRAGRSPSAAAPRASTPTTASSPAPSPSPPTASTSSRPTKPSPTVAASLANHPAPPIPPGGAWWGVDSSGPITAASLANVHEWYRGGRPKFWGRYVSGDYAVSRAELAYARDQGIYVYLIVNDRNCSQCAGGDICGNDRTAGQARTDALAALAAAKAVGVPRGAVLFKDIEQVSSCRGEPSAAYLTGWWHTLQSTDYRTGFYGNVNRQFYDFPVGYCAAVKADPRFATEVVLDMNEPEPRLGVPRGSTGPDNTPSFKPNSPSCAPPSATVIWQYGESTDRDNDTDIDQANPATSGMLAPDGTIS